MFFETYKDLTEEGQEEFLNNILIHACAQDIVDGLYIEKLAMFGNKKEETSKKYRPMVGAISSTATTGFVLGSILQQLIPVLMSIVKKKSKIKPDTLKKIDEVLRDIFNGKTFAIEAGLMKTIKEMKHNTDLANEDRNKLEQIYAKMQSQKTASYSIDEMYKNAKITVPSKDEIKKEVEPNTVCNMCPGKINKEGICSKCGNKPKSKYDVEQDKDTQKLIEQPMDGISVHEADEKGRMDDYS